jgi:nitrile hydratase accessory protein
VSEHTRLVDVDHALARIAPLPRSNGELVFDEPWQGRALGMAVVALERAEIPWQMFSRELAHAIAKYGYDPAEPAATAYYAAWLDALETTLDNAGRLDNEAGRCSPNNLVRPYHAMTQTLR